MRDIYTIYPDKRFVSEQQIRDWYQDAVCNNDIDNGACTDINEMIHELEDIGQITIGKAPSYDTRAEQQMDLGDKYERLIRD